MNCGIGRSLKMGRASCPPMAVQRPDPRHLLLGSPVMRLPAGTNARTRQAIGLRLDQSNTFSPKLDHLLGVDRPMPRIIPERGISRCLDGRRAEVRMKRDLNCCHGSVVDPFARRVTTRWRRSPACRDGINSRAAA